VGVFRAPIHTPFEGNRHAAGPISESRDSVAIADVATQRFGGYLSTICIKRAGSSLGRCG